LSNEVFGHKVPRGVAKTFQAKVGEFADGTPISLTVRVVIGTRDGPRATMLGVQHGDEYAGMEISNRIVDCLDPREFRGVLVSIPVSNPLAFNAAERASPPPMGYENLNMNRVWPGDHRGLLMERIAATVWDQAIKDSDLVVDFHEGGRAFMARYIHARGTSETEKLVGQQNKKLYELFGQGVPVLGGVNTSPNMMGSLSIQTGLVGIPTLSPELGGGGRLWDDLVSTGVQGVKNVMIGLGMINEEPVGSNSEQLVSDGSIWPKTEHGGVMYNCIKLGAVVEKDTLLSILKDTAGRVLEECRAPYRSVIFDIRYQPTVYPGDWTFHCGRLV
jgi:predicted deacylase